MSGGDLERRVSALEKEMHSSDLASNVCFWLFVGAVVVTFVVLLWVGGPFYYHHHVHNVPAATEVNPGYYMKHQRTAHRRKHSTRSCTVGETWDAEVGLCAPTAHIPLALDAGIMNTTTKACDSFYGSMCGRYIATHTNENRAFSYGWRRTRERLKQMIAGPGDPPGSQNPGSRFYQACMARGTPAAAKEALLEYHHVLEVVLGPVRTHADMPSALGRLARYGYTTPFAISMERHPLEPRVVPFVSPDGFPDAVLEEGRLFQVLQASRALTGYSSLQEAHTIESVLRISRSLKEHRAPLQLENVTDYGEYLVRVFPSHLGWFRELQPRAESEWSWERYFHALDGNALRFAMNQTLWMPDRAYLGWFIPWEGWRSFSLLDWRAYMEFSVLWNNNQFDPDLPNNVYFRQHDARGPVGPKARLYHRIHPRGGVDSGDEAGACLALVEHMLPGWVADTYLRRYMPDRAQIRAEVPKMVSTLLDRLKNRVRHATWLSDEERALLVEKADLTLVRVLEPDEWQVEPFLASLSVDRHDHNMNLVRRYRVQRNLALWHRDNPLHWSRAALAFFAMPLTEMNAYYSGPSNSITLLAGVLQSPLYDVRYDVVSKWAILGSVVGHELAHMLDSSGLHWDAQGNYMPRGLLSPEGTSAFFERTECVVREYGPAPAGCEDANAHYGNSTIDEDMADLVGIGLSYESLPDSVTMGDRQHFAMVLAQAFCETYDQAHRCEAVAHDEHAVAEFRIDRTLRNMGWFAGLFGCREGQAMWEQPEEMCQVWELKPPRVHL